MSYLYSKFPVRTLAALHSVAFYYLSKPSARQPGPSRSAFMPILVTPQKTSLFTVRYSDRERVSSKQSVSNGYRLYMTNANYYRVCHKDYRVAELTWSNGEVRELSIHLTKAEADAALKAEHASR